MTQDSVLTTLVKTGRRIMMACDAIQDVTGLADQFPLEERRSLANKLATDYHSWYAKAQANLPGTDVMELTKLYEGNFFSTSIKHFFEDPLKANPFHNEQTERLFPLWLYPYARTLKSPMMQQITILERRLENRPSIIKIGEFDVRLPRNLAGHQLSIEDFLRKNPFETNVFLMMKYRDSNKHVGDIIKAAVANVGLKLWLANDVRITEELATNVIACLLCCKFGIALFDEPEDAQHINPNVAYELGMLHLLDRQCLILKSANVQIQSDLLAKLYVQYDPVKPGEIIELTKKWFLDVGVAPPIS
jgi:hypothetical protein